MVGIYALFQDGFSKIKNSEIPISVYLHSSPNMNVGDFCFFDLKFLRSRKVYIPQKNGLLMLKKSLIGLLGRKQRTPSKKVDVLSDIEAISEFLSEVQADTKELLSQLKKLKELEQEYHVATSGIVHVNLETQAKLLDKFLERYGFFQSDVDRKSVV